MQYQLSKMSGEDDQRYTKMPRIGNLPVYGTMPLHLQGMTPLSRSNYMVSSNYNTAAQQQQMLSFSSNNSQAPFLNRNTPSSSAYTSAGYGYRSFNPGVHVPYSWTRGNFTQSQLNELNQQLWIMTHIAINVSLPSHLLNYLYGSTGTFSVGSGSNDSEPGRENHVFDKAKDQPHSLCPMVPGLGSSDSHSSFLLNSESNVDEFFIDLTSRDDDQESQDKEKESHHNSKIDEF